MRLNIKKNFLIKKISLSKKKFPYQKIMRLNIKLQWTETHTGQGLAIFFHLSWTTSDLLLQKLDTLSFLKTKHLPI